MTKPFAQLFLEMRACEALLNGGVRVDSGLNHEFVIEQLMRADGLIAEFNAIPHTDRYWADEMIADETFFALEQAIDDARDYIRSNIKLVGV